MTEIKTARSHGTLREGGEREYTANKIQREVSERASEEVRALRDSMSSLHSFVFVNV